MEKFVMFVIKINISKLASNVLVKKYIKLKRMNLMSLLTRASMNFLPKLLILNSVYINLIKNGNSDLPIILLLNGIHISCKFDTGT